MPALLFFCTMKSPGDLRILFLGTPDFAAESLRKLHEKGARIVAVVTAPDKPAGRGLQLQKSAVKLEAERLELPILQPTNLKDPEFLSQLKALEPDLGIVVAFRMLPLAVWQLPALGTFNLHASLLPAYRGAAPINWALINGENETGITTFFLKHEIDTGDLLMQRKVEIQPHDDFGSLYEKLKVEGADLVWETVVKIAAGQTKGIAQDHALASPAPKIFREHGRIDFTLSARQVVNLVRGLSPVPGAYTQFQGKNFKIYKALVTGFSSNGYPAGSFARLPNGELGIAAADTWIAAQWIQLEGKKAMSGKDFLLGHRIENL